MRPNDNRPTESIPDRSPPKPAQHKPWAGLHKTNKDNNMNTIEKLDTLAEFYSQRDTLNIRKIELLEAVTVPADVKRVLTDGWAAKKEIEAKHNKITDAEIEKLDAELETIQIPDDIREALALIDRQRAAIEFKKRALRITNDSTIAGQKNLIEAAIQRKTAQVFAENEQRKVDINIEFNGKADDVDANIKALEAEIKEEVKAGGVSVKGKYFHAIWVKGRVTWNTDKMEAWMIDHPFLAAARKEGEPSITLRKI